MAIWHTISNHRKSATYLKSLLGVFPQIIHHFPPEICSSYIRLLFLFVWRKGHIFTQMLFLYTSFLAYQRSLIECFCYFISSSDKHGHRHLIFLTIRSLSGAFENACACQFSSWVRRKIVDWSVLMHSCWPLTRPLTESG